MRICLPLVLALLAVGCTPIDVTSGWDPSGENCASNTRPFIGDAQINSTYLSEEEIWIVVMGVRWADPGESGAGDPGNMLGGEFTTEVSGFTTEDITLSSEILESGCAGDNDPDDGTATYCSLVAFGNACPPGTAAVCQAGGLAFPWIMGDTSADDPIGEGDELSVTMRVRDACGITSNTISGPYTIGSGLTSGPSD